MKKFLTVFVLLVSTISAFCNDESCTMQTAVVAPTKVNIKEFIESLTLEELLTLLSIGKIKQLTDTPRIAAELERIQEQINAAFDEMYAKNVAAYNLPPEAYEGIKVAFQKKTAWMVYALLYKKAQKMIEQQSTAEEKAIFDFQLTPKELSTYLA